MVNAGVNQARDALHTTYPIQYLFDNAIHMYMFRAPECRFAARRCGPSANMNIPEWRQWLFFIV